MSRQGRCGGFGRWGRAGDSGKLRPETSVGLGLGSLWSGLVSEAGVRVGAQ